MRGAGRLTDDQKVVDLLSLGTEVAALAAGSFVMFVLGNVYFKQAFKREIRLNAIETLIKQLGIKDFHPKDLNSDKLDDKGFARLVALIQVLYATQSSPTDPMSKINALLAQWGSPQQPQGQQPGYPFNPQGQPTSP